jgi:signal transduction histidine kinase
MLEGMTELRRTRIPPRFDVSVAAAAIVLALLGTMAAATLQEELRPLDAGAVALVVLAAAALAWRRRAPVAALGVIVALVVGYLLLGYPYGPILLCMVLAMFEVARQRGLRISLLACAAAVAAVTAAMLPHALTRAALPVLLLAVWASWLVIPWSVGALVHVRVAAARRERRELAARAALEERMRVAREVHDVAGHGFAAVAMQAGVALLVLDEQPDQVKTSLEVIRSTSTRALADLRRTLDTFQEQPGSAADGQGLRDLGALADSVRAAGLPVRLEMEPALALEEAAVPEDAGAVAYRVVQEALTNVLRHAGPTTADVRVRRDRGALVVEVLDDGAGAGAGEVRAGRGLAGMRDRVAGVGGELVAQPRAGGGFQVLARLPVTADAAGSGADSAPEPPPWEEGGGSWAESGSGAGA